MNALTASLAARQSAALKAQDRAAQESAALAAIATQWPESLPARFTCYHGPLTRRGYGGTSIKADVQTRADAVAYLSALPLLPLAVVKGTFTSIRPESWFDPADLERAGNPWFSSVLQIAPTGICNVDRSGAWGAAGHASMNLRDRRGWDVRGLRFHAYHSGPVTHDDGRADKRYTYNREGAGAATPQYVVRFCGDWVGAAANPGQALAVAWTHALERANLLNGRLQAYPISYRRAGVLDRIEGRAIGESMESALWAFKVANPGTSGHAIFNPAHLGGR